MNAPETPDVVVFKPSDNDVLMGAGHNKLAHGHMGNICFKALILLNLQRYMDATLKRDKSKIVESIIRFLAKRGTRFLRRRYRHGLDGYIVVTDRRSIRDKVAHAIRDCYYSPKEGTRRPEEDSILREFIAEQDEEVKAELLSNLGKKEQDVTLNEVATSLVGLSKRKQREDRKLSPQTATKPLKKRQKMAQVRARQPARQSLDPVSREPPSPVRSLPTEAVASMPNAQPVPSSAVTSDALPPAVSSLSNPATATAAALMSGGQIARADLLSRAPSLSTLSHPALGGGAAALLAHPQATRLLLHAQSQALDASNLVAVQHAQQLLQALRGVGGATGSIPVSAADILLAERAIARKQLLSQLVASGSTLDDALLSAMAANQGVGRFLGPPFL